MTPVQQSRIGPDGDCLPACVASILELPLAEVPHFNLLFGKDWESGLRLFLRRFGLDAVLVEWASVERWLGGSERTYSIVSGTTEAGRLHSVVYRANVMVHDPAPAPIPFVGDPVDVILFVTRDPSRRNL